MEEFGHVPTPGQRFVDSKLFWAGLTGVLIVLSAWFTETAQHYVSDSILANGLLFIAAAWWSTGTLLLSARISDGNNDEWDRILITGLGVVSTLFFVFGVQFWVTWRFNYDEARVHALGNTFVSVALMFIPASHVIAVATHPEKDRF